MKWQKKVARNTQMMFQDNLRAAHVTELFEKCSVHTA